MKPGPHELERRAMRERNEADRLARVAALKTDPKLKIINPKPIVKEVVPHSTGNSAHKASAPAVTEAKGADPDRVIVQNVVLPQGKPRKGKSRMRVPKRLRGPESSPAGKKQAVLYAPEGNCSFCDARRTVSREGMRRLRAKPDHENVTDDVK